MASRKEEKEHRRQERLVREQAERERAERRRKRLPYMLGAAVVVVFVAVLAASLLVSGGSGKDKGSEASVPSSVSAKGTGPEVGKLFPPFRLTDTGGRKLTRSSLRGKPSIVWFTTSYCVPCQVGAKSVAQLDDELGAGKFNVLVVFVDPSEPESALTEWKDSFANPGWLAALDDDNTLANEVGLRALDTKFLLASNGVIQDIDLDIADEDYLDLIKESVEEPS